MTVIPLLGSTSVAEAMFLRALFLTVRRNTLDNLLRNCIVYAGILAEQMSFLTFSIYIHEFQMVLYHTPHTFVISRSHTCGLLYSLDQLSRICLSVQWYSCIEIYVYSNMFISFWTILCYEDVKYYFAKWFLLLLNSSLLLNCVFIFLSQFIPNF